MIGEILYRLFVIVPLYIFLMVYIGTLVLPAIAYILTGNTYLEDIIDYIEYKS